MNLYRIKHKPTGGYYTKERFGYTLSSKGKVYKTKYEIGSINITLSKSSPYYINNSHLNWYPSLTIKNEVKLDTHHSDWEIEPMLCPIADRDTLIDIAERAAMHDLYEVYMNCDDQGALFMDECIYECVPESEYDTRLKEEYQDFFNKAYDKYAELLNIN